MYITRNVHRLKITHAQLLSQVRVNSHVSVSKGNYLRQVHLQVRWIEINTQSIHSAESLRKFPLLLRRPPVSLLHRDKCIYKSGGQRLTLGLLRQACKTYVVVYVSVGEAGSCFSRTAHSRFITHIVEAYMEKSICSGSLRPREI